MKQRPFGTGGWTRLARCSAGSVSSPGCGRAASYEEIAGEEGVSRERIRQIVSEVLQKRSVDSGADHAKLQLDRLVPVMQVAAEAVAAGDVSAIAPYLK